MGRAERRHSLGRSGNPDGRPRFRAFAKSEWLEVTPTAYLKKLSSTRTNELNWAAAETGHSKMSLSSAWVIGRVLGTLPVARILDRPARVVTMVRSSESSGLGLSIRSSRRERSIYQVDSTYPGSVSPSSTLSSGFCAIRAISRTASSDLRLTVRISHAKCSASHSCLFVRVSKRVSRSIAMSTRMTNCRSSGSSSASKVIPVLTL